MARIQSFRSNGAENKFRIKEANQQDPHNFRRNTWVSLLETELELMTYSLTTSHKGIPIFSIL